MRFISVYYLWDIVILIFSKHEIVHSHQIIIKFLLKLSNLSNWNLLLLMYIKEEFEVFITWLTGCLNNSTCFLTFWLLSCMTYWSTVPRFSVFCLFLPFLSFPVFYIFFCLLFLFEYFSSCFLLFCLFLSCSPFSLPCSVLFCLFRFCSVLLYLTLSCVILALSCCLFVQHHSDGTLQQHSLSQVRTC